ncbi:hypothetical protein G7Z17_g7915 [Cylindrodendrum hubeiense]|uniref:Uncharacterized protein n=1 Tax=Cylindrodendrum hubeiense TaxID=595255 RepID=A0A9P5H4Q3_9HYPO|nr:hypothetical protein G7Z17_g7915 [Cylindrodendrum hubeiense]
MAHRGACHGRKQGSFNAQKEIRRSLLALCLSSQKLNAIVTPFLYRQVILVKGTELTAPELPLEENWEFPDRGIVTLGLFLRTMLERPELRSYVRQLDVRFFLIDIPNLDRLETPLPFLQAVQEWEFGFLSKIISCAKSEYDSAVLDYVGISEKGPSDDLAERTFTAILCLIPTLHALAFPPPPGEKWCRDGISHYDEDLSLSSHRDGSYYHTASSLLELAYHDTRLSSAILQNLETVRLTFVPEFTPSNSRAHRYHKSSDPTLPVDPNYTFQIDACLGVLLAPNLKEFETDMDTGTKATGFHHRGALADLKVQRAFLTTNAFTQDVLEHRCLE